MNRLRKLAKWAIVTVCVIAAVLLVSHFLLRPDPSVADAEQYAVLSAYVESGLTGYPHDLPLPTGTVVIFDTPTYSSQVIKDTRLRQYVLLLSGAGQAKRSIPHMGTALLFNFYATNFRRVLFKKKFKLPAPYELATGQEIQTYPSKQFELRFRAHYGFITFSRVGFNRSLTEAFFYTEHVCGLCGEGKWVFMRKHNGRWAVEDTRVTWVS